MRAFIGCIVLILESIVMMSIGYNIFTWQWWAILLLTVLYAFVICDFLD